MSTVFRTGRTFRPLTRATCPAPRIVFTRLSHSSISEAIIHDHTELREHFDKYLWAEDASEKQEWANQYRWELARHSVAEELVLYPAFETYLGEEGKRAAAHEREEHQTHMELQAKLDAMDVSDPQYRPMFEELQKDFADHVKGEEAMLDKLESTISDEATAALARSLSRTKMFVPTRAHPGLPKSPPFETVAALLLAPVDKLRDMFDKFPDKSET